SGSTTLRSHRSRRLISYLPTATGHASSKETEAVPHSNDFVSSLLGRCSPPCPSQVAGLGPSPAWGRSKPLQVPAPACESYARVASSSVSRGVRVNCSRGHVGVKI